MHRLLRSLVDFRVYLPRFTFDAATLDRRITARLGRGEAWGLFTSIGFSVMVFWLIDGGYNVGWDYTTYMGAANADFFSYYYADWFIPIFKLLDLLPYLMGFVIWTLINIAAAFYAIRVFGGTMLVALTSYQMFYVLYYGNITGVILGGLALLWWALAHGRWHLAGLGLLIACTKPQIGVPFGALLLLLADISWRDRFKVLIVPAVISVASLIVFPLWPLDTLDRLQNDTPVGWGSVTLWRWIGFLALPLWLPALLLPMKAPSRAVAVVASMSLASPYFQQTDLLLLFALPIGWLGVLGNLGYAFLWYKWTALRVLAIIPALAYAVVVGPLLMAWWRARRGLDDGAEVGE